MGRPGVFWGAPLEMGLAAGLSTAGTWPQALTAQPFLPRCPRSVVQRGPDRTLLGRWCCVCTGCVVTGVPGALGADPAVMGGSRGRGVCAAPGTEAQRSGTRGLCSQRAVNGPILPRMCARIQP